MKTLQELQAPIDKQIVEGLISATPETWNKAEMLVERHQEGTSERMTITITSPEGHRDPISATDEIYEGLYRLADCFSGQGRIWTRVFYSIELDPNNHWKFKVEFAY